MLLLLDTPAFAYSFFGAQKIGAVPIPTNTLLKSQDYRYILNDSRATVAIVSQPLLPQLAPIPRDELPYLQHLVVDGAPIAGAISFDQLLAGHHRLPQRRRAFASRHRPHRRVLRAGHPEDDRR